HDGVPDKLHAHFRRMPRVPVFFKRENRKQKIHVAGELIRAAGTGSPDLRGHILDNLWIPGALIRCLSPNVFLDSVGEAAIEPRKIHTNDGIRSPVDGNLEQLEKPSLELE